MNNQRTNTENAVAFYLMMFNDCQAAAAIEQFVGDKYIQHNPHVADGKQGFIDYFDRMAQEWPGKRVTIKRSVAENDFVALHCLQQWPGNHDYAGIDIFRFDGDGKIVEHWDVLQIISEKSANSNGLF